MVVADKVFVVEEWQFSDDMLGHWVFVGVFQNEAEANKAIDAHLTWCYTKEFYRIREVPINVIIPYPE